MSPEGRPNLMRRRSRTRSADAPDRLRRLAPGHAAEAARARALARRGFRPAVRRGRLSRAPARPLRRHPDPPCRARRRAAPGRRLGRRRSRARGAGRAAAHRTEEAKDADATIAGDDGKKLAEAVTWDIDVETFNSHHRVQWYLKLLPGPGPGADGHLAQPDAALRADDPRAAHRAKVCRATWCISR